MPAPRVAMARARLQRRAQRDGERPESQRFLRPDRFDGLERGDRPERDPGPRYVRPAAIVVGGVLAGLVVVPPEAPFGFLLGRFAPLLTIVAAGVLVLGTVLATVLIFGPARRRLRELESAAHRLGGGGL